MNKVKISLRTYTHECGEGCCYEEGTEWYVNGEFVHRSPCYDNGLLAVLKHLNIDATIVGIDEYGETIWEL